jgi:hypothetical protein
MCLVVCIKQMSSGFALLVKLGLELSPVMMVNGGCGCRNMAQ